MTFNFDPPASTSSARLQLHVHRLGLVGQSGVIVRELTGQLLPVCELGIQDLGRCVYFILLLSLDLLHNPQTHTVILYLESMPGTWTVHACLWKSFYFVSSAGLELRALCMQGESFTTELHRQPGNSSLLKNKYRVQQVGQPTSVGLFRTQISMSWSFPTITSFTRLATETKRKGFH